VKGLLQTALVAAWLPVAAVAGWDFDREAYEEPDVATFAVLLNPDAAIYGIGFGHGTWLRGTPIIGDYFVRIFHSGIEDAWYSGLGMTLRVMPRAAVAPFVGTGGSYNYSLSQPERSAEGLAWRDQGRSYWGGHVESGLRVRLNHPVGLLEVFGRYTWTSFSESERDYWLVGISTGAGY